MTQNSVPMEITWEWRSSEKLWCPYSAIHQSSIESAYRRNKQGSVVVTIDGIPYKINFSLLKQSRVDNVYRTRDIRRQSRLKPLGGGVDVDEFVDSQDTELSKRIVYLSSQLIERLEKIVEIPPDIKKCCKSIEEVANPQSLKDNQDVNKILDVMCTNITIFNEYLVSYQRSLIEAQVSQSQYNSLGGSPLSSSGYFSPFGVSHPQTQDSFPPVSL